MAGNEGFRALGHSARATIEKAGPQDHTEACVLRFHPNAALCAQSWTGRTGFTREEWPIWLEAPGWPAKVQKPC